MKRPVEIAVGIGILRVLDRLGAGGGRPPARARRATTASPQPSVKRGPLLFLMLACLTIGMVLMIVFHAPVTRIVGVTALFGFIVSGVFLIADPAFLGPEEDTGSMSPNAPG